MKDNLLYDGTHLTWRSAYDGTEPSWRATSGIKDGGIDYRNSKYSCLKKKGAGSGGSLHH